MVTLTTVIRSIRIQTLGIFLFTWTCDFLLCNNIRYTTVQAQDQSLPYSVVTYLLSHSFILSKHFVLVRVAVNLESFLDTGCEVEIHPGWDSRSLHGIMPHTHTLVLFTWRSLPYESNPWHVFGRGEKDQRTWRKSVGRTCKTLP